jgi:penicillin-binding protein 1C
MGNFSGETVVGRTGSSIPALIAADLLRALEGTGTASGGAAIFGEAPGNVREAAVCALSGMAATSACGGTVREWLPAGRLPAPCSWHRGGEIEYPPEYRAWLRERFRRGQAASAGGAFIRLPAAGSVFYFDPALPPEAQAIRVEAAGFGGEALVYDNDVLQGGLNGAGVFALPLRRGLRRVVVEDESGASAAVEIEVR